MQVIVSFKEVSRVSSRGGREAASWRGGERQRCSCLEGLDPNETRVWDMFVVRANHLEMEWRRGDECKKRTSGDNRLILQKHMHEEKRLRRCQV
jgi:hypothetical protein